MLKNGSLTTLNLKLLLFCSSVQNYLLCTEIIFSYNYFDTHRLINALREDADEEPIKFNTTNADAPFRALENIETFTKCAREYGVPETSIFASADLYEGQKGPFIDVINCLNELGVQVGVPHFKYHEKQESILGCLPPAFSTYIIQGTWY